MTPDITAAADIVAQESKSDVFFLAGEITRPRAELVENMLAARTRRDSVLFVLVSQGGDPDAAFRIARAFQFYYTKASCFIPGWCKSAGTLIALAASTLYVGDLGELGPLDIQVPKQDELDEAASGLLIDSTMKTLETTALRMFINVLKGIRKDTGVTTKMAAELAAKMVVGLMGPVFSQVEPLRIGENARAMNITRAYGARLNLVSKILPDLNALDYLVSAYPDHGFVIDRKEAKTIFRDVQEPPLAMNQMATALGTKALYPPSGRGTGLAQYLSTMQKAASATAVNGVSRNVQSTTKGRGERSGGRESPAPAVRPRAKRAPRGSNGHARSP